MIKILGASVKIVNQIRICKPFVKSCGVFAVCIPMFILGNDKAAFAGIDVNTQQQKASAKVLNLLKNIIYPQKSLNDTNRLLVYSI